MKVAKTIISEVEIDLDDWFSYHEMTEKEKHIQVSRCLDDPEHILEDGGTKFLDKMNEIELLEWELEK